MHRVRGSGSGTLLLNPEAIVAECEQEYRSTYCPSSERSTHKHHCKDHGDVFQ